jgi:hypothetical protein
VRLVLDLSTDSEGRPVGSLRINSAAEAEAFGDWLDLLRLLEVCIDESRDATRQVSSRSDEQTGREDRSSPD